MAKEMTWHQHTEHGTLDAKERNALPASVYAFPEQRKEPLTDARHVQNALARFDQVQGVSDADRDLAFVSAPGSSPHRTRGEQPW